MIRNGLAIFVLWSVLAPGFAWAQNPWQDDFESFEPSWRQAGSDTQVHIDRHFRQARIVHTGKLAEWIEVTLGNGTYAHLSRQLTPSSVIDEWTASLWVWANRPGVSLLARAVLPRTLDPATGQPFTVLLRGARYGDVDRWQRLEIRDPVRLLQSEVRLLRARLGNSVTIDPGEAYIDQLILDSYAGAGRVSIALDDMHIAGAVPVQSRERTRAQATPIAAPLGPTNRHTAASATTRPKSVAAARVDHNGTLLLGDGRAMFVRAIRYRGESVNFLKQLGFNTIRLDGPPTAGLLDEAKRVGMWIVCPPPVSTDTPDQTAAVVTAPLLDPANDRVLAWDMGSELAAADYDDARERIDRVRRQDRLAGRPLICQADSHLRAYSRQVDFLVARRQALGTTLELNAYRQWLNERSRLARPGTPFWVVLPTEPDAALLDQISVLTGGSAPTLSLAAEKIRLLVLTSLAAGARGILFESNTRLDTRDAATERRARVLQLTNLELQLIEPWAASGSPGEVVPAVGKAPVTAAVLMTRRSQVLMPMWTGEASQWVPAQAALNNLSFVVPGVSEETQAYEMTPAGLRPLKHERVTGGMQVTLDEFGVSSIVLLTSDEAVIANLSQRLRATRGQAAQLIADVARAKYEVATQVARGIVARGRPFPEAGARLQAAEAALAAQRATAYSGGEAELYRQSRRAMRPLRMLERAAWDAVVADLSSPVESPFAVNFATLPQQIAFAENVNGAVMGENQLPAGGCENLDTMQRSGWRPWQHEYSSLAINVALSPALPHGGVSCLSISATAAAGAPGPDVVESPPVWVTTPPVHFEASQLVRIHGWVRVPQPIQGSVDGLLVIDSWTGEALASRFAKTDGWQEFTLYRAAPQSADLTLTFALTGIGEASIDDLTIQAVLRPGAAATPAGVARQGSAFAPAQR